MSNRYSCICRSRKSACYARYYLEIYTVLHQEFQLFPAASEKEGVSALQSDDLFPFEGFLQKKSIYVLLLHSVFSCTFTGVYQLGSFRYERHHSASDERIIDDYISLRKDLFALQRDE